jgi:hypothetical protein
MYETKKQPLAPAATFYKRTFKSIGIACLVLLLCLLMGVVGYHHFANIPWIDAIHNASMILSGMGPVVTIETTSGKIFSSFYALFSGVVFITNIGLILAPAAHRLFHKLHMEEDE